MIINLPPQNDIAQTSYDTQSIILIGANGSGKTRMSIWIEDNNSEHFVHRVSAQKSLSMPESVQPSNIEAALEKLLYGTNYPDKNWLKNAEKRQSRWSHHPETALLNDYQALLEYLVTEDYEKSIDFRNKRKSGEADFDNTTKLEQIIEVWEDVIQHRKLHVKAGKLEATKKDENNYYNGSEMSDGERAIFYFIGEVLSSPQNSIVMIDEPENHLHISVLFRLWDRIEALRKDCAFVYITHHVEFATSRDSSSKIIWVRDYQGNANWDYSIINSAEFFEQEDLLLAMLGNRKKTLFIESKKEKTDYRLYSSLFSNYTVIPIDGCQRVIQVTKAFNTLAHLHFLSAIALIDRDRRDDITVEKLQTDHIFTLPVAEIENIFLLEDIICQVMKQRLLSDDEQKNALDKLKSKVFEILNSRKDEQALLFTKHTYVNIILEIANSQAASLDKYSEGISQIAAIDVAALNAIHLDEINEIIGTQNYTRALQMFNYKGLIGECGILTDLKVRNKDTYIDTIIRLINSDKEEGKVIREVLKIAIALPE